MAEIQKYTLGKIGLQRQDADKTDATPDASKCYRVFRQGRFWYIDPKTKKIVGPADGTTPPKFKNRFQ